MYNIAKCRLDTGAPVSVLSDLSRGSMLYTSIYKYVTLLILDEIISFRIKARLEESLQFGCTTRKMKVMGTKP